MSIKKLSVTVLLIYAAIFLAGCPKGKTKTPDVISERVRKYVVNKFDDDRAAYDTAVKNNELTLAKVRRDELIFQLKRHIDSNYAEFENNLFIGKASSNILFDITELGAVFAATITNGERAKTIISGALSAFKGGRKSIDVNLFRERTTESLISTMRASRSRVEEKINLGLANEVSDYTLEESLGDLINYFYAGSLSNALVVLSQQASEDAKNAKTQTDITIKQRLQKGFVESKSINDIRDELSEAINSADQTRQTAARGTLLRALEILKTELPDLNVTFNANDTNANLFKELQRILKLAAAMDEIPTAVILRALQSK